MTIKSLLKQRNILKNNLQTAKLMDLGLYEHASKIQKPTIETISKSSEDTKKGLELIKKTVENEGELTRQNRAAIQPLEPLISIIKPINKIQSYENNKYVPQKTNRNREYGNDIFPIWMVGNTEYVFIELNDTDYIYNITKNNSKPIILTDGLQEIFFNNAQDKNLITENDIQTWEELLKDSGVPTQYKASRFYKDIKGISPGVFRKSRASRVVEVSDNDNNDNNEPKKGTGFKTSTVIIPSDPNQLRSDLVLQLSAAKAGNNSTFNHVNGILKEMMKQKLIKSKDYRAILREFYHI